MTSVLERRRLSGPVLAAGVTVLLWASAFVSIRSVGHSYSPAALALGRLLVGSVVLGSVLLRRRLTLPRGRAWLFVIAYGLMWFAGYNVALNAAERHLDAGTSAMLINVGPVLIGVMAGTFLREGFPRRLVLGSAIALAGAVVIGAAASGDRHTSLAGVGLCLVAAVLYAIGVTVQKSVLRGTPALSATWLGCTIGGLACLPFAPDLVTETRHASAGSVLGLIYLGVFPTAVAFTTWAYALARTEAGKMGATTYLVPLVAALMSWAILGEVPQPLAWVGGGLCLVGVAVTRHQSRATR